MASFLAMTSPKEAEKIVGRGFFIFRVASDYWAIFSQNFLKTRDFSPKKVPKIRKNAKNEKSATNNFFELLLASHSQKIGCLAKKVEK